MTVKGIFKVLLASIVIPIVGFLLVEFYNISAVSIEIGGLSKLAASSAATLFTQESYKTGAGEGSLNGIGNQRNLVNKSGELFVSGRFYTENSPEGIYNSLYKNEAFKYWMRSEPIKSKGKWESLKLVDSKINENGRGLSEDEANLATILVNTLVTPSNIGVPYLDKEVMNKMFRWNLAELFSSGKSENIKKDSEGRLYASFNGYRVYANLATINELEYRVYDMTKQADRVAFQSVTSVNPNSIGGGIGELGVDENKIIAVVGITYSIPTGYEGVTPIKRAFEFMWNTEVNGLDGKSQRSQVRQEWNDALASYDSGGFDGNTALSGILPVPGRLVYYIVR